MKILAIADKESKNYWDFYEPGKLDGIDLIISCGDLNPDYLQFLVTFAHAPVLYVHGNHDDRYEDNPPDGCICIEDKIYVHEGVRILGLGGSIRYKNGIHQYDQKEMRSRVRKLRFSLWRHHGFDILVTHAPAYGVGDGEDRPHNGFTAFVDLLEKYHPRYFLHGHVHKSYGRKYQRFNCFHDTLIINAYETHVFEYETEYEKELPRIRKKKEKELKIAEEKAKENQKRELKEEQKKEQIEDLKEEQIEEQQIEEQQIEEQREEIVLRAAEE
ncbi:MAG: metallophosphoesterase family protein [Lachnospiraceae bacterium]|nr:metallophosphoesterase family protein [Lachnospiraceae bacterium]